MNTAIQLWTLRDHREPLPAVLDRIAAAGYDGVEFAGIGDPEMTRQALDAAGLAVAGVHVEISTLQTTPDDVREQVRTLGSPHVVVPYLDETHFADAAAVESTAATLNTLDAEFDRTLLYHNHDHEFGPVGDVTAFDRLVAEPSIRFELDVGWVRAAGCDPVRLLGDLRERVPVVHLKDVTADGEPTALGDGVVDLQAVVDAARTAGTEWLVFEHDDPDDPVAAIQQGFDGLSALVDRSV